MYSYKMSQSGSPRTDEQIAADALASMQYIHSQEDELASTSAQSAADRTQELLDEFMKNATNFDAPLLEKSDNVLKNMKDIFLELYANTSAVTHTILHTVYSYFSKIEGVYESRIERIDEYLSANPIRPEENPEGYYERLLGNNDFRILVRDTIYIYSLFGGNRTAEEAVASWERDGSALEDGINFSTMAWLLHQIKYLPGSNPEIVRIDVAYNDVVLEGPLSRIAIDKKALGETSEQANARIADQRAKQTELNLERPQLRALLAGEEIDLISHLPTQAPPGQLYAQDEPVLTREDKKKPSLWVMPTEKKGIMGVIKSYARRIRGITDSPKQTPIQIKQHFSKMKQLLKAKESVIINDAAKKAAENSVASVFGGAVFGPPPRSFEARNIEPNISGLRRDRENSNTEVHQPRPVIQRTSSEPLARQSANDDPLSHSGGGKRKTKRRSQNKHRKSRKSRR